MEKYRKTVKLRLVLCSLLAVTTLALSIYLFLAFGFEPDLGSKSGGDGFLAGFPCGICAGSFIISVFVVFRCLAMLGDEKKLRTGYNKDNDERMKLIRTKAGYPFCVVTAVLMILAGLLLARFDITVSITAIICALCQLLVSVIFKAVYLKIL